MADGSQDVDLLVSGNLNQRGSNVGTVDKYGAGTMRMTGVGTYSGGTGVRGGVLEIMNSSGIGSGYLSVEGGTLRYLGSGTDTSSRVFWQNNTDGTFDIVNASANLTFNSTGGSQGSGGSKINKVGAGQLTLGNVNLTSGAVVSAGTLQLGSSAGSANAGSDIGISNGATLFYYNPGAQITLGNTFSGQGNLRFGGPGSSDNGSMVLNRASASFSGPVSVQSGARVWLQNGSAIGNGAVTVAAGWC